MPEVGAGDHLIPRIEPRDDHVDDDGAADVLVVTQVGVRDHPADVVADDRGPAEPELLDQPVDDRRERPLGAVGGGARRLAHAGQVDRDGAEVSRRPLHHRPPLRPGLRPAVQQDNRLGLRVARLGDVQRQPVQQYLAMAEIRHVPCLS
jgi:hypothetical protein